MQLTQLVARPKTGQEPLLLQGQSLSWQLLDFWRWSVSDLLSNTTRGRLAEFLVATAVGVELGSVRNEWAAFDLLTPAGVKLEIKSSAYLQAWYQRAPSAITFSIKPARYWDASTNQSAAEAARHADVYVCCLLHHQDKASVNPLDLDQWTFYVLATVEVANYTRSQHSITLKSLQKLTAAVSYAELAVEVQRKHQLNTTLSK